MPWVLPGNLGIRGRKAHSCQSVKLGAEPKLQGCKAQAAYFFPVDLFRAAQESPWGCPNTKREGVGGAKSLETSENLDRCKITFGDFFLQERIFPKPPIFRTFFSVGGYADLRLSGPKTGLWTLFFPPGCSPRRSKSLEIKGLIGNTPDPACNRICNREMVEICNENNSLYI